MPKVPNQFPTIKNMPYRIAIIGEAPGRDEEALGEPFVGMSGRLLNALLDKANVLRRACFVGNVCQVRPEDNDINNFALDGPEIQEGLTQLSIDLEEYQPNICLLLGKTALWAMNGEQKIGNWRGTLFEAKFGDKVYKCISSYHPAACLRKYEWTQVLLFDIRRAVSEATFPQLHLPIRDLHIPQSTPELLNELEKILVSKPLISIDIEGGVDSMSCISIAPSKDYSFIVPLSNKDGSNYYETPEEEADVWRLLSTILADVAIHKVLQNALYDRFVLQYSYHIFCAGVVDDTMLKQHELYCELEKGLAFQTSIHTREPFYKSDRKSDDRDTFWRYCCRDSAVTYEINTTLRQQLDTPRRDHYNFNVGLLNPLLYMELVGIKYDTTLAKQRLLECNTAIYALQNELDTLAGFGITRSTKADVMAQVTEVMAYKRDPSMPKTPYKDVFNRAKELAGRWEILTPTEKGELATYLECELNIKSQTFKNHVYKTLGLPEQRDPISHSLTTDYEALLKIFKKTAHPQIDLAIQIGSLRTRSQMLEIHADSDGRIRCGYNIVGTETGRITCYTSPTGSGYNLQTIPSDNSLREVGHPLHRGMRDLFIADEGCCIFQCDLKGADGWTVGAHCKVLGDTTMFDDLSTGIKPAAVICYMLRHGNTSLLHKSREEIKNLLKEIKGEDWDYFACKCGIWGTCYLMGPQKLSNTIFIQSEGKVNLSLSEAKDFQNAVFTRYRVKLWHAWMSRKLAHKPEITSASGHRRRFYGRSTEILGEALAHEPQANTTYATNLAVWKLWTDKENRQHDDKRTLDPRLQTCSILEAVSNEVTFRHTRTTLKIQPLHQVHDALLGQFKISNTPWAIDRIKSYFANEIVIAGIPLTIPFDGKYGRSWGELDKAI